MSATFTHIVENNVVTTLAPGGAVFSKEPVRQFLLNGKMVFEHEKFLLEHQLYRGSIVGEQPVWVLWLYRRENWEAQFSHDEYKECERVMDFREYEPSFCDILAYGSGPPLWKPAMEKTK